MFTVFTAGLAVAGALQRRSVDVAGSCLEQIVSAASLHSHLGSAEHAAIALMNHRLRLIYVS